MASAPAPAPARTREGRFRKRPVEVEAWQVGSRVVAPEWLTSAMQSGVVKSADGRVDCLLVETLEGTMLAVPGAWIIQGVKGELYPCDPEIFALTYEPVE